MNRNRTTTTRYPRAQYIHVTPYRLPDPLRSWEDWQRFEQADVADMTPHQRRVEHWRASNALAAIVASGREGCIVALSGDHIPASAWLTERIARTRG